MPSLALKYDMWGALELVSSRIGLNACALVVPDSVDLGAPVRTFQGSGFEPMISRAIAGWQLGAPVLVASAGFMGSRLSRPSSC
jgi:hypothetical protein